MLTLRRCVGGVVAVLLMSGVALAQTPTDIATLRVRANAGDADAQTSLAIAYFNGEGIPQDDAQAMLWFRKAAEQGDADAQFNLGAIYERTLWP
jgi:TPR repeat protein